MSPEKRPTPPIGSTQGVLRRGLHLLFAVLGWLVFAWAWYVVFYRRTSDQTLQGVIVVAVLLVITVTTTLLWVRHNLRLHREKPPRTRIPAVDERWEHDHLGRPVEAVWEEVRAATRIEIELVGETDERKRYTCGGGS